MTIPIRIKRSNTNTAPGSLVEGELAFSNDYLTNTGDGNLYIGADDDAAGVTVRKVGGVHTVFKQIFDANTILAADTDDTPAALTVPVQTLVGRITAGNIDALTPTEVRTLLGVEAGSAADQNLFETVTIENTDSGYTWVGTDGAVTAATTTDDIQVVAGANVALDRDTTNGAIRITASASGNTFEDIVVTDTDSGYSWTETGTATAVSADTLDLVSGTDIDIDVDATSKAIKIAYSGTAEPDQNLFETITGDTGSFAADSATNVLEVLGAGLLSTVITDAAGTTTCTISTTAEANQNAFGVVTGDSGTATADVDADSIAITGTGLISTAASDGPEGLVISTTATADQNLFATIDGDTGAFTASGTTDTLEIVGSGLLSTTVTDSTSTTTVTLATTAEANVDAFGVVTGNSGTATADGDGDSIAITGANGISTTGTAGASAALSVDGAALAEIANTETISAVWTYSTLPESSVVPTTDNQLTNKLYVDNKANGLDYKESVRCLSDATSGLGTAYSYNATGGTSSRGQITWSAGPTTIDTSVTLANDDRILNEEAGAASGIYIRTSTNTWDRAEDFDADVEVTSGATVWVEEGTVYAQQRHTLVTVDPIVIGGGSGTALAWGLTGGSDQYTAGDGLDLAANVFSVDAAAVGTITVAAGGIEVTPRSNNYVAIYDGSGDLNAEQYLSSARGGTGVTTQSANTFLYGSGAVAMSSLAAATGGSAGAHYILAEPADGGAPSWLTEIDGGTY